MTVDDKYINGVYGGTQKSAGNYSTTSTPAYNQGVADPYPGHANYTRWTDPVKTSYNSGQMQITGGWYIPPGSTEKNTYKISGDEFKSQGLTAGTTPINNTTETSDKQVLGSSPSSTNYWDSDAGEETERHEGTNTTTYTQSQTTESGTKTSTATGTVDAVTQYLYDRYKQDYQQSQAVTDAYNKLNEILNQKPGEYNSEYTDKLSNLYEQIIGQKAFSYTLQGDSLYDIYKQRYDVVGQQAMKDIQGQYASNTGGYANSAGNTAGYQAYQGYLNELDSRVPDLYSMAYNRFKDASDIAMNKYDIAKGREDSAFERYESALDDWMANRDYYEGKYQDTRDFEYSTWNDAKKAWTDEYWRQKESEWTVDEEKKIQGNSTTMQQVDNWSTEVKKYWKNGWN